MKRGLTLLLASLVLAVGLTACGGDTKQDYQQNGQNSDNIGSQGVGGAGSQNGTGSGDTLMDDASRGINHAVRRAENAMDDLTGNRNSRTTGPSWNGNLNGSAASSNGMF